MVFLRPMRPEKHPDPILRPGWRRRRFLGAGLAAAPFLLAWPSRGLAAEDAGFAATSVDPGDLRIPQFLLNLVHSVEGQREMGVNDESRDGFESVLRKVDADWLRLRVKPEPEQRRAMARAEKVVLDDVESRFGARAVSRLRQLELQAQSARAFLRPDVGDHLGLETGQKVRLAELVAKTEAASAKVQSIRATNDPEQSAALIAASAAHQQLKVGEWAAAEAILTPAQRNRFRSLLGVRVDTSKFGRIHALVPELIDTGHWLEDRKVRLADLRGKVVLVHFYAFQCHNCQANFGIYKRWHASLKAKGVELVGIQTPETAAERDPAKVIEAAHRDGFEFPVLIDLKNPNWTAWGNSVWPTVYVVDKRGYLRSWWVGELNWQGAQGDKIVERLVDRLRSEPA